jgi:hypothetical protein
LAITRVERNGVWIEKADTPADARKLHEKHGPDLQARGAKDFQEKYKKDLALGFEKITDPSGNVTHVRTDRMETALQQGYGKAPTAPRMVVPTLPWQADRRSGERYSDYMARKAEEQSASA